MTTQETKDDICCPQIDPTLWDDKIFQWENKRFVKDRVCTFFFMPLNFSQVMKRLNKKVRESGAVMPDWLCLSDHTSKWNMTVYLSVDKELPSAENVTLSGKFLSKVYDGPFKDTGKWCQNFENHAKAKGLIIKKMYMWYTTCPKCAKKYGKNYVVIISEVE